MHKLEKICMGRLSIVGATLLGLLAIGGCSDSKNPVSTVDPIVEATSTDDIKAAAAAGIGSNLDVGLNGAGNVVNQNSTFLEDSPLGSLVEGDSLSPEPVPSSEESGAQSLLNSSLGLQEDSGAETIRDGSQITIDPDDSEVCAEGFLSDASDAADIQRCEILVSDIIVQIDATSDVEGMVTYFFQDEPFVVVGYAPDSNSIEIILEGAKRLSDANNALDPDYVAELDSVPETVQGAIQFSATTTNSTEGQEAGSVSVNITQPLSLSDSSDGVQFDVGVSTLFSIAADSAAGIGSIEFDVGAVQVIGSFDQEVNRLNLSGLTGKAELAGNTGALTVTNLGIGSGPFTYTIDSVEVIRATMETFGFTVDQSTGETVIDGNIDLSLFIDETLTSGSSDSSSEFPNDDVSFFEPLARLLEITAPSGTAFIDQVNGSLLVSAGGPVGYSLTTTGSDEIPLTNSVTINAGQCFEDGEDDRGEDAAIVACDQ